MSLPGRLHAFGILPESGLFRPRAVTIANYFFIRWPLAAVAKIDTGFRFLPNHPKAVIEQSNSIPQRSSGGGWVGRLPPGARIHAKSGNADQNQPHAEELQSG